MSSDDRIRQAATIAAAISVTVLVATVVVAVVPSLTNRVRDRASLSYRVGQPIDVPPRTYAHADTTLLLFVRSSCAACRRHRADFAALAASADQDSSVQLKVVIDERDAGAARFVQEMGVGDGAVLTTDLEKLRVRLVPTVVVVDSTGTIRLVREGTAAFEDARLLLEVARVTQPASQDPSTAQWTRFFVSLALQISQILLLVAVLRTAWMAWNRREPRLLDFFLLGACLIFGSFGRETEGIRGIAAAAATAVPFLLLRCVRYARPVPLTWWVAAAALPVSVLLAVYVWGISPSSTSILWAWRARYVLLGYCCVLFWLQARRSTGPAAQRFRYLMIGSAALGASVLSDDLGLSFGENYANNLKGRALSTVGLVSYFVALTPPRRLARRWRLLQDAHFEDGTTLAPLKQGARAADALLEQATRSVNHTAGIVALRTKPDDSALIVRAATDTALVGQAVVPGPGLIGRACDAGVEVIGPPEDCEPELADWCRSLGNCVVVAPIRGQMCCWGVVLLVQEVGSLFVEDDRHALARFGQRAGTALDHAHLVKTERDRERQAADRRVQASETRLSLMLDSIKDYAMIVLDSQGSVVTWQAGATHVFGHAAGDTVGTSAASLLDLTAEALIEKLGEAEQNGVVTWEGRCHRADGRTFVGTTTIRPLEPDENQARGFVAVTRDVTAHRNLETQLRQGQKMEAIGQLAGGVAHDFNNLLTAILGYAESLEQDRSLSDTGRRQAKEIGRAAERAADLTHQLLAVGRRQPGEARVIDLSNFVGSMLPMLRRVIGEHITIVSETQAGPLAVVADRGQLEQIMLNLAVNARDAMADGGRLSVRTRDENVEASAEHGDLEPGPYAVLEVADTGHGMDEDTQARIFEPFFTTKGPGHGTGLGLATVYGIVTSLGGTVRIDSTLDQGTTFRVYLPKTDDAVQIDLEPVPNHVPGGDETILLVEDDMSVRMFLEHVLEQKGYHVLSAEDPASALALVKAYADPIHLVITDIVMPGGNGIELVARLDEIRPGLPVLYVSGYAAAQGGLKSAQDLGRFLQKPFSATTLLVRVRSILSSSD